MELWDKFYQWTKKIDMKGFGALFLLGEGCMDDIFDWNVYMDSRYPRTIRD